MRTCDRIWRYIDDAESGQHASLRDALYQLLVAVECGGRPGSLSVERCLDLAAEAIRDGSRVAVAQARALVDELVVVMLTRRQLAEEGATDSRAC